MAKIQQCECGARYNVEKFKPGSRFKCKKCGNVLKVDFAEVPQSIEPEMPVPIVEEPEAEAAVPEPVSERPTRPTRPRGKRPERPARDEEERDPRPRGRKRPPSGRRRRPVKPEAEEAPRRRRPRYEEEETVPIPESARPERPEVVEEEQPRPRRRPPSSRRRAAVGRETRPVEPIAEEPPEPEVSVEAIPEDAFVTKEDFAEKRATVMKSAPGFVVPFVVNLVVFLVCVGGGIFAVSSFAKAPTTENTKGLIDEYESRNKKITERYEKLTAVAESLGTVSASSVVKSVRTRYSKASKIATAGTVTVISDIDVFQGGRPQRIEYYGSGFIFKPDGESRIKGYILTCYENIAGARSVKVMLSDHTVYSARPIGSDVPANLAVLQLDEDEVKKRKPKLVALDWTDSDEVKKNVAQYVISAGTPAGRTNSVALGVISCPDRYTQYKLRTGETSGLYNQFFQTDAQINWGSSGGPLVDLNGKVTGVCVTTSGLYRAFNLRDYNGLFFAIQSNFARKIANQIKKEGYVNRSYTGILVDSLQALDLEESFKGTAIVGIEPGSPAETSGLAPGDIITRIKYKLNGEEHTISLNARYQPDLGPIYDKFASLPINTEITFELRDIDRNKKSPVKLKTIPIPKSASQVINALKWGLVVSPLSLQDANAFGLPDNKGVKVLAVMGGSPAAMAGISPGNALLFIDDKQITDVKSFESRYENLNSARMKDIKIELRRNSGALGVYSNEILRMIVRYN